MCSIICQLWNFKARIKRCWKWSTYMTTPYFSFSESLLTQNPQECGNHTSAKQRVSAGGRWPVSLGRGIGSRRDGGGGRWTTRRVLLRKTPGASNPPGLGRSSPSASFSTDRVLQAVVETQLNTKFIQENKVWYSYLFLKVALGCRLSWKMSFMENVFHFLKLNDINQAPPCCKIVPVM